MPFREAAHRIAGSFSGRSVCGILSFPRIPSIPTVSPCFRAIPCKAPAGGPPTGLLSTTGPGTSRDRPWSVTTDHERLTGRGDRFLLPGHRGILRSERLLAQASEAVGIPPPGRRGVYASGRPTPLDAVGRVGCPGSFCAFGEGCDAPDEANPRPEYPAVVGRPGCRGSVLETRDPQEDAS